MPKKKLPYYDRKGYAYVYVNRQPVSLKTSNGRRCKTGTKEALCAYHRYSLDVLDKRAGYAVPSGESDITIEELAAGYLTYLMEKQHINYDTVKTIIGDFLLALYGSEYLVDAFTPKCLKNVREMMIKSKRLCRRTLNFYVGRIVAIFAWGVEEELVKETTYRALKLVKPLEKGHPGTRDNAPREDVPLDVVVRLLPFLVPVLQAMVQIQGLHGMRSSEVCNMRVGEIDCSQVQTTGFWYYTPASHKTQKKTGKKTVFPLGKYEQQLLLPYLEGKEDGAAVFSPAQAVRERATEQRANRKSKLTPSAAKRDVTRAAKSKQYSEMYTSDGYRKAIQFGIAKANKVLPDDEKIPKFHPYQLRHAAITKTSFENGKDAAQALAGHTSSKMTETYDHSQLKKWEWLARKRKNPFIKKGE